MVLLGFAAWRLLTLFGSIGVYHWSRILISRASIAEWRADLPQGSDWYQRAMRAHMNCVDNLPVYAAIVVALTATGLQSPVIDFLAVTMLAARIGPTLAHITPPPTNAATSLRFALFFIQMACMIAMGVVVATAAPGRTAAAFPLLAQGCPCRRSVFTSASRWTTDVLPS